MLCGGFARRRVAWFISYALSGLKYISATVIMVIIFWVAILRIDRASRFYSGDWACIILLGRNGGNVLLDNSSNPGVDLTQNVHKLIPTYQGD